MAMYSWTASDALKSACDKGHNWISTRANNYKSFKSGYNKIRPKLFPKGLSTFKKEHCRDENETVDRFLSNRARACSLDASFYAKNLEEINFKEQVTGEENRSTSSLENHDVEVAEATVSEIFMHEDTLQVTMDIELVVTPNRSRRSSVQNTKVVVRSSDQQAPTILPGVLLTYNEKFTQIGSKPKTLHRRTDRVYRFGDSIESSEV